MVERYLSRISGPLIDRIDIHVEVPPVAWRELRPEGPGAGGLDSGTMRGQVVAARRIQRERFAGAGNEPATDPPEPEAEAGSPEPLTGGQGGASLPASTTTTNATMSSKRIRRFCKLDSASETLLKQAMTELGLSARAHDKVLRIARTIADLEGEPAIQAHHLAEAICARGILAAALWKRVGTAA